MEIVRKKQIRISRAIATKKIKLARVSKPSQLANAVSGSGKMAIRMNASGRISQAIEWRIVMRFFARLKIIRNSRMIAAMRISICSFSMLFSPYSNNEN